MCLCFVIYLASYNQIRFARSNWKLKEYCSLRYLQKKRKGIARIADWGCFVCIHAFLCGCFHQCEYRFFFFIYHFWKKRKINSLVTFFKFTYLSGPRYQFKGEVVAHHKAQPDSDSEAASTVRWGIWDIIWALFWHYLGTILTLFC